MYDQILNYKIYIKKKSIEIISLHYGLKHKLKNVM